VPLVHRAGNLYKRVENIYKRTGNIYIGLETFTEELKIFTIGQKYLQWAGNIYKGTGNIHKRTEDIYNGPEIFTGELKIFTKELRTSHLSFYETKIFILPQIPTI